VLRWIRRCRSLLFIGVRWRSLDPALTFAVVHWRSLAFVAITPALSIRLTEPI
jgi:hypothetical protein